MAEIKHLLQSGATEAEKLTAFQLGTNIHEEKEEAHIEGTELIALQNHFHSLIPTIDHT